MVVALLKSAGITAVLQPAAGPYYPPLGGAALLPMDVMVSAERLADARELLVQAGQHE